jgi:serine/threonine protein kinase
VPTLRSVSRSVRFPTQPTFAKAFALTATTTAARAGAGTFGRVRLAQSVVLADKSSEEGKVVDGLHSGYFAVKILKKSEIIRLKQTEHVKSERDLLFKMNHPFIVTLHGCYKDERNLFMVLEYVPGGEVLAECRRDLGKLDNDVAK